LNTCDVISHLEPLTSLATQRGFILLAHDNLSNLFDNDKLNVFNSHVSLLFHYLWW